MRSADLLPVALAEWLIQRGGLGLDRALLAIRREHGIDPDGARRMAGADPFDPVKAGYVTGYKFVG